MTQRDKKSAGIGKGTPGPGRPKGKANNLTTDLRTMIERSLERAGGEDYLYEQSKSEPRAYLALVAKLLPTNVAASIAADGTITVRVIRETILPAALEVEQD